MAKECPILPNKRSRVGGGYSNEIRATKFNPTGKRRRQINLQKKQVFVPELKKTITVVASTKGFKTIKKNGAFSTLQKAGLI